MTSGQKRRPKKKRGQPKQESPWPKRLLGAAGVGVVLVLVAAVLFSKTPLRGVPDGTEQVAVGQRQHVDGLLYDANEVPAGGPHAAVWANCGYYETPIAAENAVHSLEHGAVWITYRPDVGDDQINRLRGFVRGIDKVLVSPVPGQATPIIATAWATQLELSDANDDRLEQFVNEFEGSRDAPEPGGAC